jgi:hypothetical protein
MAKGRRQRALPPALAAARAGALVALVALVALAGLAGTAVAQQLPDGEVAGTSDGAAPQGERGPSDQDAAADGDSRRGGEGAARDGEARPPGDAPEAGRLDRDEGYVYDEDVARSEGDRRGDEQRRREEDRAAATRWAQELARQRPAAARLVDISSSAMPGAYAIAGIGHRGDLLLALELKLGGVAAVGAGYDDRLLVGDTAGDAEVRGRRTAWFRLGVAAGRWFAQQPALDVTFQRSDGGDDGDAQFAALRLGGTRSWRSQRFGSLDLTVGAGLWEVAGAGPRLSAEALGERLRPYGGVAWTPPSYPRTSLLLEGWYGPSMIGGAPRLDWRLGWGARYQVLSWSAIDLVVRNRQDAGLPGSTVMVRLSAQLH